MINRSFWNGLEWKGKRDEKKRQGKEVIGVSSDVMEKIQIGRKCDQSEMEERVSVWWLSFLSDVKMFLLVVCTRIYAGVP